MEYQGKRMLMTIAELADAGITYDTVVKLYQRGQADRVQRSCKGVSALYSLDSLPLRYKVQVYERYPDLMEKEQSKTFVEEIELDLEAAQYYADYTFGDGRHLPSDRQAEYAHNASILNAYHQKIADADAERR